MEMKSVNRQRVLTTIGIFVLFTGAIIMTYKKKTLGTLVMAFGLAVTLYGMTKKKGKIISLEKN